MDRFTLNDFWLPRLGERTAPPPHDHVDGWSFLDANDSLPTFQQPPVSIRRIDEVEDNDDPKTCDVLLVSAPGAVGKSTLAKEIAVRTGSVYIDLAEAEPVGGDTLGGGLFNSNLGEAWRDSSLTALIDGLDEARLKTDPGAFEAYLRDVAKQSRGRKLPTVLFGRTGAIHDAFYELFGSVSLAALEIQSFDDETAVKLAMAAIEETNRRESEKDGVRRVERHPEARARAVQYHLEGLRKMTPEEGNRFTGYAPVILAVAERVREETNPAAKWPSVESTSSMKLHEITDSILERESGKVNRIPFKNPALHDLLYRPEEQLDRLASSLFRTTTPSIPPPGVEMDPDDIAMYKERLDTWVEEHPFIDRQEGAEASAVFGAAISAHVLRASLGTPDEEVVRRTLTTEAAANPFLWRFFLQHDEKRIDEEHVGLFYSSVRAGFASGDSGNLTVTSDDEPLDRSRRITKYRADVLITRGRRRASEPQVLASSDVGALEVTELETTLSGSLNLGNTVMHVDIDVSTDVGIGSGRSVSLIAPVSIDCARLRLDCDELEVRTASEANSELVRLSSDSVEALQLRNEPSVREGAILAVSFPEQERFPWYGYGISTLGPDDIIEIDEGLRRLRQFVLAFKSSVSARRGGLVALTDKIESKRKVKGDGQLILDHMKRKGIVRSYPRHYRLSEELLRSHTGLTYMDCRNANYGEKAKDFVRDALKA